MGALSTSMPARRHQRRRRTTDGVEYELKVGDVIGIQCDEKKARCTVIWAMSTDLTKKNQVGIKLLADQECPWKNYLSLDGATVTFAASNRRRFQRHRISLPIELRDERIKLPARINATDVSGNGCYVETMSPMPAGTVLRLNFWIDSYHMNISAVVRTCDPGVGWYRVHRPAPRWESAPASLSGCDRSKDGCLIHLPRPAEL